VGVARFILRRIAILVVQVWGVVTVVFLLIQLLPGDPRYLLAGGLATPQTLAALTDDLGLDQPIHVRYIKYMGNVATGDLGKSWFTSTPVLEELKRRFPATLELVTFAFVAAVLLAVPLGVLSAVGKRKGIFSNIAFVYGMVAGALPEFWWALMMILLFFVTLGIAPAPLGRIDIGVAQPDQVTGLFLIDSLLDGNVEALGSAFAHLLLPGLTLAFVYGALIVKMTRTEMLQAIDSDFARYARACGMSERRVNRMALRNALLPIITLSGFTYGYLISGAVLVETVFSWGGLGQFAVQSVVSSDYFAVTGTVMAVAVFALVVYLLMDILYAVVDPRIRYAR
jgi:ABC-type dipeptide/oligopeptide/nickel transport system permease component